MIITPCKEHGLEDLIGKSTGERTHHRIHMSDIYGRYFDVIKPRKFNEKITEAKDLYMEAGLSFETVLEDAIKARLSGQRPGELVTEEGIYYSPDLILYNHVTRLGEIKVTWMSNTEVPREPSNGWPPKFDKYFVQMMAYCYHLETPYARLYAFFVNGDYRPPRPELLAFDIEFTKRELDENWRKLLNVARTEGMI